MLDDPYKAPSVQSSEDKSPPPRVVVIALLGIIAVAAVISFQNYQRRAAMKRAVNLRRVNAELDVEARKVKRASESASGALSE